MINYFNFLVKYNSISKSIATLKRRIEKCCLNDEIRDTGRNLLDEPVCTHSGRIESFSIYGLENWCEEKVV